MKTKVENLVVYLHDFHGKEKIVSGGATLFGMKRSKFDQETNKFVNIDESGFPLAVDLVIKNEKTEEGGEDFNRAQAEALNGKLAKKQVVVSGGVQFKNMETRNGEQKVKMVVFLDGLPKEFKYDKGE